MKGFVLLALSGLVATGGCRALPARGDTAADVACAILVLNKMTGLYRSEKAPLVFLRLDSEATGLRVKELEARDPSGVGIIAVPPNSDLAPATYEGRGIYIVSNLERRTEQERVYQVGAFHGSMSGYFWTIRCRQEHGVWIVDGMEAGPVM